MLLFAIIFLWTPPHFWALCLFVRTDYANAGVPMLPVWRADDHPPPASLYTLPMVAAAVAPWALGLTGAIYGVARARSLSCSWSSPRVLANRATEPAAMKPEKRLFALFDHLSVRSVRRAGRRPLDCLMTPDDQGPRPPGRRAKVTALLLGAFVVLMFAITIAKMAINQ